MGCGTSYIVDKIIISDEGFLVFKKKNCDMIYFVVLNVYDFIKVVKFFG